MNLIDHIQQNFQHSVELRRDAAPLLAEPIAGAATLIVQRLLEGSKILCCGNGDSAAEAQRFSANMLNRYERERPGLPALALSTDVSTLTAIACDYDFDEVFAKQVHALGHPGDLLLAISADGDIENINAAVAAAQDREMFIVALSGGSGGRLTGHLREQDIEIRIPSDRFTAVREMHVFIIHCLCDLIDLQLLGN